MCGAGGGGGGGGIKIHVGLDVYFVELAGLFV